MFILVRAITYSALFMGIVLVFLPARLLSFAGIARPEVLEARHIIGAIITVGGVALVLWCVLTFAIVGKGTAAPFDPPRRLVVRGPYTVVRNPIYIGAGLALVGASLFYGSLALLGYTAVFFLVSHLFVILYEEPTLRRTFGTEYEEYCREVGRWLPRTGKG